MLVSTNRTIVHLVAAQPSAGAELADPGLDLALQRLKPGELIHPSGQLLEEGNDQRAHRGVTLRGGHPGIAVDVIGNRDRNVLHIFTACGASPDCASGTASLWLPARPRLGAQGRSPSSAAVNANVGKVRRASVNDTDAADSAERIDDQTACWRVMGPADWRGWPARGTPAGPRPTVPRQAPRPHHAKIRASPLPVREA